MLGQPINQRAILTSLELGLTCASISVIVGTPIAWLISRMVSAHRAAWLGLLNVAAHFGGIGLAFAYIATLGTLRHGHAAAARRSGAIRSTGARLVRGARHHLRARQHPALRAAARAGDGHAARRVGGGGGGVVGHRWQFWRRIGLPVLAPFIGAGFVLVFTWSIGIFGIAYALVGSVRGAPHPAHHAPDRPGALRRRGARARNAPRCWR